MTSGLAGVIGLGVSGKAAAQLLHEHGYAVVAFDQKTTEAPSELASFATLVSVADADALGRDIAASGVDFAVASPGIPLSSPLIKTPTEAGVEVIGEVEAAWRFRKDQDAPWLAVTGTNGKTTTVGMTDAILRQAGWDSIATGNIGYPITKSVREGHAALVVELSSFQLATITTLRPWTSICMNVDSDHLDWHGSVEAYQQAKALIYDRVQRARLYFADDPSVAKMAKDGRDSAGSALVPLYFGEGVAGGVGIENGLLMDSAFTEDGATVARADLTAVALLRGALGMDDGAGSPMVRDALAASALALSLGVDGADIVDGLNAFQAAPHRFALVPTRDGVTWIDDSKATNVHAAAGALRNVQKGTAVWIVGGDAKGQDLRPLVAEAADQVRAAVIIGADREELVELFFHHAPNVPFVEVEGTGKPEEWMPEVVRACREFAREGDTVLLAPACASWDQFSSYSQRGDLFRAAVGAIADKER